MERRILHVDVNNAFLSWTAVERLKNGEELDIRTIPAVIGGDENSRHGIVLAKSMKAKQCGIVTGEALYFARKKCPGVQVYQSDFSVYRKYSEELYKIFLEYTDKIERFSIDECFLDMTEFTKTREELIKKGYEINEKVKEELGFTVNVGIANNKLLAKMASDFEKPDKVHTLFIEEIQEKMWRLPISELFMVGRKTLPKLEMMQIKTIGDLAKSNKQTLTRKFGKHGILMWEYENGIDNSEVEYESSKPKCIGNSTTLAQDINDINKINEILLALSEQVCFRLRKQEMLAKVVNVQIKTKNFEVYSHQKTMDIPTDSTKRISNTAKELLKVLHRGQYIRLIGVSVSNLSEKAERQISLFDTEKTEKEEKLDKTIDLLKEKYGYNKVTIAGKMNVKDTIKFKD